MSQAHFQFNAEPFIKPDETVLVIGCDPIDIYHYEALVGQIDPVTFLTTTDSRELLTLYSGNRTRILMVDFNAMPIEGCIIVQLFKILATDKPTVVLLDENNDWREEAGQAQAFGFSAALVNPITPHKWEQLCGHLAQDTEEFVIIK